MYDPKRGQSTIDFEMGSLLGTIKKIGKGVGKVTEYTITKPSAMIGKTIGGKRGEAIGRKLGGFTAKVTNLGVGAGAAGAAAGFAPMVVGTAATGIIGKKLLTGKGTAGILSSKKRKKAAQGDINRLATAATQTLRAQCEPTSRTLAPTIRPCTKTNDNALAAKVASMLVARLSGPLAAANKKLALADLQRTATYEHRKLMSDADFRKKVLAGITIAAAKGDNGCQKTIRVLVGR